MIAEAMDIMLGEVRGLGQSVKDRTNCVLSLTPSNSEDHRGTPEAPGRVATIIDRQLWETLTDQVSSPLLLALNACFMARCSHIPESA